MLNSDWLKMNVLKLTFSASVVRLDALYIYVFANVFFKMCKWVPFCVSVVGYVVEFFRVETGAESFRT